MKIERSPNSPWKPHSKVSHMEPDTPSPVKSIRDYFITTSAFGIFGWAPEEIASLDVGDLLYES